MEVVEGVSMDMQPILKGTKITLRPITPEDAEALYVAASDPKIWEQHPDSQRYQREVFDKNYLQGALSCGSALVVIDNHSGELVGSSRFYEYNAQSKEIAIGYTFLATTHWGGETNAEMKRLMLDYAFRFCDTVWFHIGKENWRSRKAMEKIGGQYSHEGTIESNGVSEPYVFYKITAPS